MTPRLALAGDETAAVRCDQADADRVACAVAAYQRGARAYEADQFEQAAADFHAAFALDGKAIYLFNAARAEQRALLLDAAQRDYLRVLELPDVPEPMRQRCAVHLDEIRTTRARTEGKDAAPTSGVLAAPAAPGWRRPVGIATIATGAVSSAVGAVVLGIALGDDNALSEAVRAKDAAGKIRDIDYHTYDQRRRAIERNHTLGHGLLWAGVVVAGVGGWLALDQRPGAVTVQPAPGGVVVGGRF